MGTSADEAKWLKEKFEIEAWDDEKPDHVVYVSEFHIGRFPVTNADYRAFIQADGYNPDKPWWQGDARQWRLGELKPDTSIYSDEFRQEVERWLERRPAARRHQPFFWDDPQWNADNLPVVGVTWYEAQAYCNWLRGVTGQAFRLPTEAEWERAARGQANTQWPWGDEWDAGRGNSEESQLQATTPVGMYPHGAALWPTGAVEDLVGNVLEWCSDWWDGKLYETRAIAGQVEHDPQGPTLGNARVVRGGSYFSNRGVCRAAYRNRSGPALFDDDLGFRVVRSP
jgi:formylglycine-generating enzyme required for sulfatase activity